jgi:transposase
VAVPDAFWAIVEPHVPQHDPRSQGGGIGPLDAQAVCTAIVYVLTSRCAWRHLLAEFGVNVPTPHRRFLQWAEPRVFDRNHRAVLDRLGVAGELDWSATVLDAASVRANRRNH